MTVKFPAMNQVVTREDSIYFDASIFHRNHLPFYSWNEAGSQCSTAQLCLFISLGHVESRCINSALRSERAITDGNFLLTMCDNLQDSGRRVSHQSYLLFSPFAMLMFHAAPSLYRACTVLFLAIQACSSGLLWNVPYWTHCSVKSVPN